MVFLAVLGLNSFFSRGVTSDTGTFLNDEAMLHCNVKPSDRSTLCATKIWGVALQGLQCYLCK